MDTTSQGQGLRAEFTGDGGQFFRLALIGNLLQIPTFGFYRFWLTTDIRRHLWSHTRIGGEALEYTGRGRELLIGFLIAMAILTPIYTAYFLLSIEAERWQAFASVPLFFIIYGLMHFGSYRARRYRATRTVFRGVRLWMTGSGWAYAGRAMLWDMLTLVTLGLALPWRAAALESYRMRHTHFGDVQGKFTSSGWEFFKRGSWLWFLTIASPIFIPGAFLFFYGLESLGVSTAKTSSIIIAALIPMALILTYPLFRAIEMRWWLDGIRIGGMSMTSDLSKLSVLWAYGKAMLIVGIATSVGAIIFQVALDSLGFSFEDLGQGGMPPIPLIALIVGFYILALIGMAVIFQQFVTRGLWQLATESLTVFNLEALDDAAARGGAASGVGEGLADALDFGGGGL